MKTRQLFLWLLLNYLAEVHCKLVLLQTVFRHGEKIRDDPRAPGFAYYPNDPYPASLFPMPQGHLTEVGQRKSFELGLFYRQRYGDWLSGDVNATKFLSSPINRTQTTAQLVAAGLFAPNESLRWSPELRLDWPVVSQGTFHLMFSGVLCSNNRNALDNALQTDPDLIAKNNRMREFNTRLRSHTGYSGKHSMTLALYDALLTERNLHLKLPDWTENIFPEGQLKDAAIYELQQRSWNDELKRLSGGLWLKEWLDHIDAFINSANNSKFKAYFYSGHDINLASILITLGIFEAHIPAYNNAIIFELHSIDTNFFIKVLYRQDENVESYVIPGCGQVLCPLATFKRNFQHLLPGNVEEACGKLLI